MPSASGGREEISTATSAFAVLKEIKEVGPLLGTDNSTCKIKTLFVITACN